MLKLIFLIILSGFGFNASAGSIYTHDIGHLHLSEQKWELQHVLNLTEYMETSDVLKECVGKLNSVCREGKNPLCSYFKRATENINMEMEANTSNLHTLKRNRRFIVFVPIVIGVTIVSFWAGIMVAKAAMNSIKDELRGNLEIIEQAANISIHSIDLMEKFMKETDKNMLQMQEAINNNTKNIELQTRFFNIINVITFTAQIREKMQIKLNDIYYGKTDSRLFEIIEFQEFLNNLRKINEKLKPNLTLPNITSMSKNKFIKTYTDFNETHLTVSVDLPVMRKSGFNISEIIPLPIQENGTTYILDIPTTQFYTNGSKVLLFPDEKTKNTLCKTERDLTICNTFLEDYNVEMSTCLKNLLTNSSDEGCTYKEIPNQNYFIHLSDEVMYFHLIQPVRAVMDCRGKVYSVGITNSTTMKIRKGCDVYKYTGQDHFTGHKISMIDISPTDLQSELELSNKGMNKKLSILPVWDKHNIHFIEAKSKIVRLKKSIPLQKQKIEEMSTTFGISDLIDNLLVQILIYAFAFILSLLLMKALIIKLLTEWKKRQN